MQIQSFLSLVLVNSPEAMNCSWQLPESFPPKAPCRVKASATCKHGLSSFPQPPHTPHRLPRARGERARPQRLQVVRPSSLPPPGRSRCGGLRPSPRVLRSRPQGRQPHQLFPAAGAPIGGRPAAPNINDTQGPGLEAQAREQPPATRVLTTSKGQFSMLSGASGSRREAETGCPEQPFVLSPPQPAAFVA